MTNDEKLKLAEIVAGELAQLHPKDMKMWLAGFIATHPNDLVHEVNLLLVKQAQYKEAMLRADGWKAVGEPLVSWVHVSAEVAESLRQAAAWRSMALVSREGCQIHGSKDLAQGMITSALWEDRVFLHEKGVALRVLATDSKPWVIEEVATLVAALAPSCRAWIVLGSNGAILEGLTQFTR